MPEVSRGASYRAMPSPTRSDWWKADHNTFLLLESSDVSHIPISKLATVFVISIFVCII